MISTGKFIVLIASIALVIPFILLIFDAIFDYDSSALKKLVSKD